MLSLCELKRAARILDRDFAGSRVERWLQPDESGQPLTDGILTEEIKQMLLEIKHIGG